MSSPASTSAARLRRERDRKRDMVKIEACLGLERCDEQGARESALMPIAADRRDELRRIALQLDALPHGQRRACVMTHAELLGVSVATLYRQLEKLVGWDSGRKTRADKGTRRNRPRPHVRAAAKKAASARTARRRCPPAWPRRSPRRTASTSPCQPT
jgi:hypothetical protein